MPTGALAIARVIETQLVTARPETDPKEGRAQLAFHEEQAATHALCAQEEYNKAIYHLHQIQQKGLWVFADLGDGRRPKRWEDYLTWFRVRYNLGRSKTFEQTSGLKFIEAQGIAWEEVAHDRDAISKAYALKRAFVVDRQTGEILRPATERVAQQLQEMYPEAETLEEQAMRFYLEKLDDAETEPETHVSTAAMQQDVDELLGKGSVTWYTEITEDEDGNQYLTDIGWICYSPAHGHGEGWLAKGDKMPEYVRHDLAARLAHGR